jgi:hypothetical protein
LIRIQIAGGPIGRTVLTQPLLVDD